jgi:hypothetical protein
MKNKLMEMGDKQLLRKRGAEPVNDFLKNICQVGHRRHRGVVNLLVNLLAALSACLINRLSVFFRMKERYLSSFNFFIELTLYM